MPDNPKETKNPEIIRAFFATLAEKADRLELNEHELDSPPHARSIFSGITIEKLKSYIDERNRQRSIDEQIVYLTEAVRRGVIQDFVNGHVQAKDKYAKEALAQEIDDFLRQGRRAELELYLFEVLERGLEKAQKKRKREAWGGGYVGHAWELVQGLVKIGIVVGVFGIAESKFETVVVALLILTYNGLAGVSSHQNYVTLRTLVGLDNEFVRVRRLLKERLSSIDEELETERALNATKTANRTMVRYYIHGFFVSIIWVIALWKLAAVIL